MVLTTKPSQIQENLVFLLLNLFLSVEHFSSGMKNDTDGEAVVPTGKLCLFIIRICFSVSTTFSTSLIYDASREAHVLTEEM